MNKYQYLTQLNSINERHRNESGGQFNFDIRNIKFTTILWGDENLLTTEFKDRLEDNEE